MSDSHDSATVDLTPPASPGDMLKQERERQGRSLKEVAGSLNLRLAVVNGLEVDDYAEVPVTAYRRGYLRAYARLLNIDDKPILAAYEAHFGSIDNERKVAPIHITRPPSRIGALLFKLVTVLVIVALIALTLLWWQSREGPELLGMGSSEPVAVDTLDGTPITEDEEEQQQDVAEGTALPPLPPEESRLGLVEGTPPQTTPPPGTEQVNEPSLERTSSDGAANDAAEPAASEATELAASEDSSDAPVDALSVTSLDEAADNAVAETDDTDSTSPNLAASTTGAMPPGTLELTFNEQSWTEIFDAGNQRVFVGLQEPGTQATVEGEPPFRLTVGNASGVELRYLGDDVDLVGYAGSNNVARFTLGE